MLPGWSGSGPQIRGSGRVTQWALGRACSYALLQTANHRHKSLPGTRTVFTDASPNYGQSSKDHMRPVQDILMTTPKFPPGTRQADSGR